MLQSKSLFRLATGFGLARTPLYQKNYISYMSRFTFSSTEQKFADNDEELEDEDVEKKSNRRREAAKKKESFKDQLVRKNKERIKHLAKEMVHLIVHGSKSIYQDLRYVAGVTSNKPDRKSVV